MTLQVLRDRQKKLELAARMHKLWEESGHTQEAIAEAIGLKHRSYQKALQTGGISYERLRKLAEFHEVDFNWLLRGEERGQTPDLMGTVDGDMPDDLREQLADLHRKLDAIIDALGLEETADVHPLQQINDLAAALPELLARDAGTEDASETQ